MACSLNCLIQIVSHLVYKIIDIWSHVWAGGDPQDWVKMFIGKTIPVLCFVYLHQEEQLFSHVCAAKPGEGLRSLDAQLGRCIGMKHANSAAPTHAYFAFSVSLHWSLISSFVCVRVHFSQLQIGYWAAGASFLRLKICNSAFWVGSK